MTMPTGKVTSIFFETDSGDFIKLADNLDNAKLLKLCGKAVRQERIGTFGYFVKKHRNAMLIQHYETDYNSAIKLVEWIKNYDLNAPMKEQAITAKLINSEDFVDIIKLYYSVGSINLSSLHRGQDLRNDIYHYTSAAPLSANEFIMIHECCAFDHGLIAKILNGFAYAVSKGDRCIYPADQVKEIENYCKEAGIWEDMLGRIEFQNIRVESKVARPDWIIRENVAENEKKTMRFASGRVLHEDGLPGQRSRPARGGRRGMGRGRGGFRGARGGSGVDA